MNLFDKLAVSLLVCFGMMLSQIEAAMPGGAFSRVAIADDRHEAYEVTQDDSFQGYAEFFLLFETFSGSYEGYEGAGTVIWQAGTYDSQGRSLTQTLAQGVTTAATYDSEKGDLFFGVRCFIATFFLSENRLRSGIAVCRERCATNTPERFIM
jgi:hypothetical protein